MIQRPLLQKGVVPLITSSPTCSSQESDGDDHNGHQPFRRLILCGLQNLTKEKKNMNKSERNNDIS